MLTVDHSLCSLKNLDYLQALAPIYRTQGPIYSEAIYSGSDLQAQPIYSGSDLQRSDLHAFHL